MAGSCGRQLAIGQPVRVSDCVLAREGRPGLTAQQTVQLQLETGHALALPTQGPEHGAGQRTLRVDPRGQSLEIQAAGNRILELLAVGAGNLPWNAHPSIRLGEQS